MPPGPASRLSLTQVQSLFAQAIMRPLTARDTINPAWPSRRATSDIASTFIKPNDRLSSLDRLQIYNQQYWYRVWDSLNEDFPGLRRILSDPRFFKTITAYVSKHPSTSFTLRNLGRRLPEYLLNDKNWCRGLSDTRKRMAIQMARFEWAQVEAFDGPSLPPISIELMASSDPGRLKLRLQPHISLLEFDFPLDDFTIALKKRLRIKKSKRPPVPLPRKQPTRILVHRQDETLFYRRLDPGQFAVLKSLQSGRPLIQALRAGQKAAGLSDEKWAPAVQELFMISVRLGWLCPAR